MHFYGLGFHGFDLGTSMTSSYQEEAEMENEEQAGLEKLRRQLAPPAGSVAMQGYLLKRSETLRRWNQRWFTLDPTVAKMEYRTQRGDPFPRGLIVFESDSTITVSPINFQAAGQVLKAHREAVNSLTTSGGSGSRPHHAGAVAAAAAVASATAREASKEVAVANQRSVLGGGSASGLLHLSPPGDAAGGGRSGAFASNGVEQPAAMDNLSIMRETLRVKDEELHQMAADMRARDATIQELADRLSETAEAAQQAADAVHAMDADRTAARGASESLQGEAERQLARAAELLQAAEEQGQRADTQRASAESEPEFLGGGRAAVTGRARSQHHTTIARLC
eukprot:jgi/Mesen1/1823/ME000141S00990